MTSVSVFALSASIAGVHLSSLSQRRRCPSWHSQPVLMVSVMALSSSVTVSVLALSTSSVGDRLGTLESVILGTLNQCPRCPWNCQPASTVSVLEYSTCVDGVRLSTGVQCRQCPSCHCQPVSRCTSWHCQPVLSMSVLALPTNIDVPVLALSTSVDSVRFCTTNQHRRCPSWHCQPVSQAQVFV